MFFGRANRKRVAARARELCLWIICGMDIFLHNCIVLRLVGCLHRIPGGADTIGVFLFAYGTSYHYRLKKKRGFLLFVYWRDTNEYMLTETEKQNTGAADEIMKAGVHFGHRTSKTHPKMKPYISGVRNTVHVLDLGKTNAMLQDALNAIKQGIVEGKTLLLVGTKVQIKKLVEETARACAFPYVSERWVGGTFTNFLTILKRIKYMNDLRKQEEEGELAKYTKQEQAKLRNTKEDLEKVFGGMRDMVQLPDMVFICDLDQNDLTAREARKKGIKVIALCDTNIDPSGIDYPIPANDDAVSSVRYILGKLKETVLNARSLAPTPVQDTSKTA